MRYLLILFFLMTTQAEAARIKLQFDSSNGVILTYRGKVAIGDADKLTKLMTKLAHRDKVVLYLHSPGGMLFPAMRLGRTIRHFGIITALGWGSTCTSACSFLFIAGWNKDAKAPHRLKNPWSKLGLHHPYHRKQDKLIPSHKYLMERVKKYSYKMQAGEGIYEMIKETEPRDMVFVKNRTLARIGGYHISRDVTSDVTSVGSRNYVYTGPKPSRRKQLAYKPSYTKRTKPIPMMPDEKYAKGGAEPDRETCWRPIEF